MDCKWLAPSRAVKKSLKRSSLPFPEPRAKTAMNALPRDASATILFFLSPSSFASVALSCREWKEAAKSTFQEWMTLWNVVHLGPNVTMSFEKGYDLPRWVFCRNEKSVARVGARELADTVKTKLKISLGVGTNEWTAIYFDGVRNFAKVLESVPDGAWYRIHRHEVRVDFRDAVALELHGQSRSLSLWKRFWRSVIV